MAEWNNCACHLLGNVLKVQTVRSMLPLNDNQFQTQRGILSGDGPHRKIQKVSCSLHAKTAEHKHVKTNTGMKIYVIGPYSCQTQKEKQQQFSLFCVYCQSEILLMLHHFIEIYSLSHTLSL